LEIASSSSCRARSLCFRPSSQTARNPTR
jgi:hypothetical protein